MINLIGLLLFFLSVTFVARGEEIFPLSQIKAGMKGTTFTVLQGTNIVSLETEILGVSEDFLGPGKDLIIGKLIDEKTQLTGAVHGMSGSPLYIDGKLAGALSRRIAMFEKDGHCGFTPIADMLEVKQKVNVSQTAWHPRQLFPGTRMQNNLGDGWLAIPLSLSGIPVYAKKLVEKIWEGSGFLIAAGGGGGKQSKSGAEIRAGAPVSVAFLTGDLTMAGTGTVTWREGNQILAFGHPMLGWGEVELPLCEAEIISTVPSYLRPFKLANVRRTVGTLTQDRLSAVAGIMGKIPSLPRYRVSVNWDGQPTKIYEGNFVSHELLTPAVLTTLVGGILMSSDEVGAKWTIELQGQLGLKNHEPLNFDAYSSGDENAAMSFIFGVALRLGQLYGQQLEKVQAEFFDVTLNIKSKESIYTIESVELDPQRPKPGQEVKVRVGLKPAYGEKFDKFFSFVLPDQFNSKDEVIVEVANGHFFYQQDQQNEGFLGHFPFWSSSGSGQAKSLKDLLEQWNQQRSANDLIVRWVSQEEGIRFRENRLENLPPSVIEVLAKTEGEAQMLSSHRVMEQSAKMDGEIVGKTEINFTVE